KAAVHALQAAAEAVPSTPMVGIFACCARRERPGSRRAAEQRDELAPFHPITSATAFLRAQPSGGRTTQNNIPLFGPTCLGAQTCAPPSGATTLLILSLGTGVHSPSTLTS